jgi:phage terminase large subunit
VSVTSWRRGSEAYGRSGEERRLRLLDEIGALKAEERRLLAEIHASRYSHYRDDPCGFIATVLREHLWAKQEEIARKLVELRRVVVSSCFASGKTFLAARLVIWWISTDPGAVAITTASVGRAVKGQLWGEIRLAAEARGLPGRFDPVLGETFGERPDLPGGLMPRNPEWHIAPGNFALGFSTADPNKFAGWHGGRVLVVLDEAEGVSDDLWDIMEGQMASADVAVLAIGNPDPEGQGGGFERAAMSPIWHHIPISVYDTPNIVAGRDDVMPSLVTNRWVAERLADWGPEHPMWIAKGLGQFPQGGATRNVVPLTWWLRAVDRPGPYRGADVEPEAGLDIARFGSDDSALAIRQGPILGHLETTHGADGPTVGEWAIERLDRYDCTVLKGDSSGLGGPVLDYIRHRRPGLQVYDVNAGAAAEDPEHFMRRRDELWWGVRLRFQEDRIVIPTAVLGHHMIDRLRGELTPVEYRYRLGRIEIEPKEGWKTTAVIQRRRRRPSPDCADATCLAFYQPPEWELLGAA